ncbi:MAG: hypothetical protein NTY09_14885 [bacterium]|nr:hypothetical protein [bacterium]
MKIQGHINLILIFIGILMVPSCSSDKEEHSQASDEIEALNSSMSAFVESHPVTSTYGVEVLDEAYSIAENIKDSESVDKDILVNFSVAYSTIATEYIGSIFEAWQESCPFEELAEEGLSSKIQDALGFDYNNELTDRQLIRLEFSSLEETFDEAADTEVFNQCYGDLESIKELAILHPIKNELEDSILRAYASIFETKREIDRVHQRVFVELRQQAITITNEARLNQLDGRFRVNYEEGIHTTWYKHHSLPQYVNSRSWSIYPTIGCRDSGESWMCLKLGFHRSDWIFIDNDGSITVVIDGQDNRVAYDSQNVDTYIGGGISEWVDICNNDPLIRRIATAERVVVSFSGNNGNRRIEHVLSSSEMTCFKETVEFVDLLAWNRSR